MKGQDFLFEIISEVQDEYLDDADKLPEKRKHFALPIVACLILSFLCILIVNRYFRNNGINHPLSINDIADNSSAVARVTVVTKAENCYYSQAEDRTFYYSDYQVEVVECYNGSFSIGQKLTIRSDDPVMLHGLADPALAVGAEMLVFLYQPVSDNYSNNANNIFYLSGEAQGVFIVSDLAVVNYGNGKEYALSDLVASP